MNKTIMAAGWMVAMGLMAVPVLARDKFTCFGQDNRDGYIVEVGVGGAEGNFVAKYSADQTTRWLAPLRGIVRDDGATYDYFSNYGGNTWKIDLDGSAYVQMTGIGNAVSVYPLQNDSTYEYLLSLNQRWYLADIDGTGTTVDVTETSSFGWSNTWGMGNTACPIFGTHSQADNTTAVNPFVVKYELTGNWYKGDYSSSASGLFSQSVGLTGAIEVVPRHRPGATDGYDAVVLFPAGENLTGIALYDWETDSTTPARFVGAGFDHIAFLNGDAGYDVLGRQTGGDGSYTWLKVDIANTNPDNGTYVYTVLNMAGMGSVMPDLVAWMALPAPPGEQVTGTVTLNDYEASPNGVSVTIDILSDPVETHVVTLDGSGNYSFSTPLSGTYGLTAKASHWLRQERAPEALGSGPVNFTLTNGDVDGNNAINSEDLSALLAGLDLALPDLDGDGVVTSTDVAIVLVNMP